MNIVISGILIGIFCAQNLAIDQLSYGDSFPAAASYASSFKNVNCSGHNHVIVARLVLNCFLMQLQEDVLLTCIMQSD